MFTSVFNLVKQEEFNRMLQTKESINSPDRNGYYLIHWAVHLDRLDIVNSIARQGANINQCTLHGVAPITISIMHSNYNITHWLLSHGAIIPKYSLHLAIRNLNIKIVVLLLRYGANINSQDLDGNTALHLAIYYKLYDLIPFLLDYNADRNIKNFHGHTPQQILHEY